MRQINAAGLAHIQQHVSTLAICWKLTRKDGQFVQGTEHDKDILISGDSSSQFGGTYLADAGITGSDHKYPSDLSPSNSEVSGSTGRLNILDLNAQDIEAGLYDRAAILVFLVNYAAPDDFQIILGAGTLGDITRTAEGHYTTERRGLTDILKQNLIRTYSVTCNAELFDQRCKVVPVLGTHYTTATVSGVTSRRTFQVTPAHSLASIGSLPYGEVVWLTGTNAGADMEIKSADTGTDTISLFLPMGFDIQVGDTLEIYRGCDKLHDTCLTDFDNLLNFRGHAFYVPGNNSILTVGGQNRVEN